MAQLENVDKQAELPQPSGSTRDIIGIHGRNGFVYRNSDYEAIKIANFSWIKMMSNTSPGVFRDINEQFPNTKLITRLYHPSFNKGGYLSAGHFYGAMESVVENLLPYCNMFEVHNEPNHFEGYEGWGKEDADAVSFNRWFIGFYNLIKARFPDAQFGFPGLAVPDNHRDISWLRLCEQAIDLSDFLCVHTYWQNFGVNQGMHLNDSFGLRFIHYHNMYPDKAIYITEAGNSNMQSGHPLGLDTMAKEMVEWYSEVAKYEYVKAACPFLLSSPDSTWNDQGFTWVRKDGAIKPVVFAVGEL